MKQHVRLITETKQNFGDDEAREVTADFFHGKITRDQVQEEIVRWGYDYPFVLIKGELPEGVTMKMVAEQYKVSGIVRREELPDQTHELGETARMIFDGGGIGEEAHYIRLRSKSMPAHQACFYRDNKSPKLKFTVDVTHDTTCLD